LFLVCFSNYSLYVYMLNFIAYEVQHVFYTRYTFLFFIIGVVTFFMLLNYSLCYYDSMQLTGTKLIAVSFL